MNQSYPAPPPELVEQWRTKPEFAELGRTTGVSMTQSRLRDIAAQAAQWGADQELEACLDWLEQNDGRWEIRVSLRDARRAKPPSRKEQALEAVSRLCASVIHDDLKNDAAIVRRALEQLPDAL